MSHRPTGPACGNNPNYRMSDGDRQAVDDFKAYLTERAACRDRIAEALDSLQGTVYHLPPKTRQRVIETVMGAVLPAPAGRAVVLREAADAADRLSMEIEQAMKTREIGPLTALQELADELRRMADEAQPAQTQPDEALCQCGHGKAYHGVEYGTPRCRLCPERGEWKWAHAFTSAAEARPPVHAVPLPGSNGISSCCGRPPCEFVGERVTQDPDKVTCPGPAADAQPAPLDTAPPTPATEPWRGATELATDREIAARAAIGLVGYRQGRGTLLHCIAHKPAPASRWADFHEVTADDLPDGGICVHPRCGRDLLAPWPTAEAQQDGARP